MIRKISLIAFLLFFAIPQFAFAQVEMCETYRPKFYSYLTPYSSVNSNFFDKSTGYAIRGNYYMKEKPRGYASAQAIIDRGLYFADSASSSMINVNGINRRCGAQLKVISCYSASNVLSTTQKAIYAEPIEGCPFSELNSNHPAYPFLSYLPYSFPQNSQGNYICGTSMGPDYEALIDKTYEPKQTTPIHMDTFSMGWFSTDNDTDDLTADWRNAANQTPVGYTFLEVLAKYQNICYDGSRWSVTSVGAIDFDANSTIINGKSWRQFYVDVVMVQKTCHDCDSEFDGGDLWDKPSPAGTTSPDSPRDSNEADTGTEGGEATEKICNEGDTRAGCATIDPPPSGQETLIPGVDWKINNPGGAPSFASPWTLSGTAECPESLSFSVSGNSLKDLDFSELCGIISGPMRAVLLMIASLTALAIVLPKP